MNIADVKFKELLNYVLDNGVMDENPRPYWEDEDGVCTPAHSLFATQYMEKFDISKKSFYTFVKRINALQYFFATAYG